MPVRNLTPATERDLYWEWVRAEVDPPPGSPRSADRQAHGLSGRRLTLLATGDPTALGTDDREALRSAFRALRGEYLDPLLGSAVRWYYGDLDLTELGSVRIPNLTVSLVPLAPSRRLEEFVRSLDDGRETPKLPNHLVYRFLRTRFEFARVRGSPVLIAERRDGPYVLAEGLTRACVLQSRWAAGEDGPPSWRVLLGVSRAARRWAWW